VLPKTIFKKDETKQSAPKHTTSIQTWMAMPANESEIVTAASGIVKTDAGVSTFGKVVTGTLYFLVCWLITPISVMAFYCCILKMLMERFHPPGAAIANDPSIYRRFIRPVGRTLVFMPLALIISFCLLQLGCIAAQFLGPVVLLVIPVFIVRFLIQEQERNKLKADKKKDEVQLLQQSAEP
jgi:hypothetical protein